MKIPGRLTISAILLYFSASLFGCGGEPEKSELVQKIAIEGKAKQVARGDYALGDINGDGVDDMVEATSEGVFYRIIYYNPDTGPRIVEPVKVSDITGVWKIILRDNVGDSLPDIVLLLQANEYLAEFMTYENLGNGKFAEGEHERIKKLLY